MDCRCGTEDWMRLTTIDIGTNTVLLLVAEIDEFGNITPLAYEQRLPRLGKEVDAKGVLERAAFDRVAAVIEQFQKTSQQLGSELLVACATSAVRDATNGEEFADHIRRTTGINIEVLSGEEEATWTYRGAVSGLSKQEGKIVVIDVGGGSTEITVGQGTSVRTTISLNIGSVRLKERFLRHDPPLLSELAYASESVCEALESLMGIGLDGATLVGVAGTVTTLAALDQGLMEFEVDRIKNYRLARRSVERLYYQLRSMTAAEILSMSNVNKGRADILTAGALILHEFLNRTAVEYCIVSERGLRFGLAIREWERYGFGELR